jgi:hypothetical protein
MRAAIALALFSMALVAVLAFAQPPPGGTPPPGQPTGAGPGARPGGGFAPPPFPGDTTAAERDSLMNEVIKSIAGKEQMPAESVFKDIQAFKGRPAGSIPRLMNFGFGRSLGVSCYHCHARNDWAKDEKKQKRIAREMFKMVAAINNDYLWKIEGLGDPQPQASAPGGPGGPGRPTVNCGTCHRGSIHANPDAGRPGGPPRGGVGR